MILDSNILIAYLNGDANIIHGLDEWKQKGMMLFVSSITVAEILALPRLAPKEVDQISEFLKYFISIPFNNAAAEATGLLRRKYKIKMTDAAIAATAITNHMPLATRDRQFRKIKEITLVEI